MDEIEADRQSNVASIRRWFWRLVPLTNLSALFLIVVMLLDPSDGQALEPMARLLYATPDFVLFFLIVVLPGVAWLWVVVIAAGHGDQVRRKLLPRVVKFFGSDWTFRDGAHFDENVLLASGLIPPISSVSESELLRGSHQDQSIQIGKMHLSTRPRKNDGHEKIGFGGVAISVPVRRTFHSRVIGLRDRGVMNWTRKRVQDRERVAIEDPEFESEFEVYSSNQEEARFLLHDKLTPLLLELAQNFRETSGKDCTLRFSFANQTLVILVDWVDMFRSPELHEPGLQDQELKQFLQMIRLVQRIVEATDADRYRRQA